MEWKAALSRILDQMKSFNLKSQSPCSLENITTLDKAMIDHGFGRLPEAYMEFLEVVNGLDWNGLVIYASQRSAISGCVDRYIDGIVDANVCLQDVDIMKDRVAYAEDGTVYYPMHLHKQRFETILCVGGSVMEVHASFSAMLNSALVTHV